MRSSVSCLTRCFAISIASSSSRSLRFSSQARCISVVMVFRTSPCSSFLISSRTAATQTSFTLSLSSECTTARSSSFSCLTTSSLNLSRRSSATAARSSLSSDTSRTARRPHNSSLISARACSWSSARTEGVSSAVSAFCNCPRSWDEKAYTTARGGRRER